MTRGACIARLASMIAAVERPHPARVALDGVDGAGKTHLADELVGPLSRSGRQIIRASIDGFHYPRAHRYKRGRKSADGYFHDSFNYGQLRSQLLDPLGPGGSMEYRSAAFDYRVDSPIEALLLTADRDAILLVDGVFLQVPHLADAWDFIVWVEAPFETTVERAVLRDAARGGDETATRAAYAVRYVPGQQLYLDSCHPKASADVIFENSAFDAPRLTPHA